MYTFTFHHVHRTTCEVHPAPNNHVGTTLTGEVFAQLCRPPGLGWWGDVEWWDLPLMKGGTFLFQKCTGVFFFEIWSSVVYMFVFLVVVKTGSLFES